MRAEATSAAQVSFFQTDFFSHHHNEVVKVQLGNIRQYNIIFGSLGGTTVVLAYHKFIQQHFGQFAGQHSADQNI